MQEEIKVRKQDGFLWLVFKMHYHDSTCEVTARFGSKFSSTRLE